MAQSKKKDTEYPITSDVAKTVVMQCSEGGCKEAFRHYITRELGIAENDYDLMSIPGSCQLLTFAEGAEHIKLPGFAKNIIKNKIKPLQSLENILNILSKHQMSRAIVIMHEGCTWYHETLFEAGQINGPIAEQQVEDMKKAKKVIQTNVPGLEVTLIFASKKGEQALVFREISEE